MNKKLKFWWLYLTNPSFRYYVHLHDIQAYHDDIKRRMEEKSYYESQRIYQENYPDKK